jgi:hypothetical protein
MRTISSMARCVLNVALVGLNSTGVCGPGESAFLLSATSRSQTSTRRQWHLLLFQRWRTLEETSNSHHIATESLSDPRSIRRVSTAVALQSLRIIHLAREHEVVDFHVLCNHKFHYARLSSENLESSA